MIFNVSRTEEWLILETEGSPKVKIYVDYKNTAPSIGGIQLLEYCAPEDIIKVLEDVIICLNEYRLLLFN